MSPDMSDRAPRDFPGDSALPPYSPRSGSGLGSGSESGLGSGLPYGSGQRDWSSPYGPGQPDWSQPLGADERPQADPGQATSSTAVLPAVALGAPLQPPEELDRVPPPAAGPRGSRVLTGVTSAVVGALLVTAGLYLLGEFGIRTANELGATQGSASLTNILLTVVGAVMLFAAVLLNGWSLWATLLPGLALTAVGVWAVFTLDGAQRVAAAINQLFEGSQLVLWGALGWVLTIGLVLLGASGAAAVARATGRRRTPT